MTESEARPAASATPASALTGRRSTPPGPLHLRPVALIKGIVDAVGQFRSLAEPLANTVTDTEWLMIGVLRGFADVERDLIRTRTAEGRSWAKARGQHIARPNLYQPPLKPTLGAHVPVMPARAGLHAVMGERGAYWCGRVILTASRVLDTFSKHRYGPAMPDTPHLRPATPDEIARRPIVRAALPGPQASAPCR